MFLQKNNKKYEVSTFDGLNIKSDNFEIRPVIKSGNSFWTNNLYWVKQFIAYPKCAVEGLIIF